KLAYPHTLDFRGGSTFDKFFVPRSLIQTKAYLSFNNFIGTGNVIFYELTNSKRIRVDTLGGNYNCLIPNSADTLVECLVIFEGDVKNIISLTPVEGTGTFTDFAASAIDSAFIIITHPSLMIEANDYASYRLNGPSNNLQNAIVFNIEDLYDQFSYGIKKHPYSIRSFMDYIVDVW
ncbi:MAG: C25 family cysteine peptidase, partial [Vicingaceae bacterium]